MSPRLSRLFSPRALPPLLLLCAACGTSAQGLPASGSSVQFYGLVDAYAGSMRRSDQAGRTKVLNSNGMTTSYWGVAGAEELGGGLKARFALESFFLPDAGANGRGGADPYFSRNAWVGLQGGFGQLSLGRQTNPMYAAAGAFNPFGTSMAFSPMMLHGWQATYNRAVLGDSVWDNVVQYATPTVGGLRASVLYGMGEVASHVGGVRNVNLTVNYAAGPFAAVVSAQQARTGPGFVNGIDRQDAVLAGASYDLRAVQLFGQLQRTRTPALDQRADTVQLGAAAPVGAGRVLASVARTGRESLGARNTAEQYRTTWAVGYDHALSKRTDVYVNYLRDRLDGYASAASVGAGVRHRF